MKKLFILLFILFTANLSFAGSIQQQHLAVIAAKSGASIPDGEIGSTCSTCGNAGGAVQQAFYFSDYTPTTAGNVRYLRAYINSGTGTSTACLHIWSDSGGLPGTDLGRCTVSSSSTTYAWKHCDTGGTIQLTSGVTYWLGFLETSDGDQAINFKDTNEQAGAYYVNSDASTGVTTCVSYESIEDQSHVLSDKIAMHADMNDQDAP